MVFLPDGNMLITERPPTPAALLNPIDPGRLRLVTQAGVVSAPIAGLSANVGLLDVKLDPKYSSNHLVYISFMERDPTAPRVGRDAADPAVDPAGLAIMRGTLSIDPTGTASIAGAAVIWRQQPKIVSNPGSGEPGGRMTFSPDGKYLFFTSGDRQEFEPSRIQGLGSTLGKVLRIFPDGSIPSDNPFVGTAGALGEIWTIGHRNQYGLAFNAAGELWENEMGPMGGDELNLIEKTKNYGWPNVSYGDNYGGAPITKPAAGDGYAPAAFWWTPVIAPSNMIFYSGTEFGDWKGDAIISGLQSKGLVRVRFSGTTAKEVQRIDLGARIRSVTQGPDGGLWVLEDQPAGRLLRLSPVF
ncbi:MAG: hypothetical protein JWL66_532 [Sphingomonadales bacterium]|nr:hypothetical protein [Sphingomonadales bacterium]